MNDSPIYRPGNFEQLLTSSGDLYKMEKAEFYANLLRQKVTKDFTAEAIQVYSFDVFDTLLLRNSKPELQRYLEIAEQVLEFCQAKGIKHLSLWDIYAARLTAFKISYRTVNHNCQVREGKLIDVLNLMLKILELDAWIIPDLVRIELTYETANLTVNPFLQVLLKSLMQANKQIIFISDMYLPGDWIYQLLVNFYPELTLTNYYASSDSGLTKSSGLLYNFVLQDMKVEPATILHMGDNFKADVYQAKAQGLNSIHLPIPELYLAARKQASNKFTTELTAQGFDLSLVY